MCEIEFVEMSRWIVMDILLNLNMDRWIPEYGQMVEEKETFWWIFIDNNALNLLPNLKNISKRENIKFTSGLRRDSFGSRR